VTRPSEAEVSAAIRRRQIRVLRRDPRSPLRLALDDGETSSIRAALAYGPAALVILDELSARKVTGRLGLHCTGTAGVIVEARRARPLDGQMFGLDRPRFELALGRDSNPRPAWFLR